MSSGWPCSQTPSINSVVIGLANTKAGNAGLLMALTPVFAYLVGVFGRRERFSQSVLAGILLSLTGVFAIILAGSSQVSFGQTWKGDLLMMGAAFCWGWYTGASAGLLAKYGALRLTVLTMVLGTVVLVPLSVPAVIQQNWTAVSMRAWGGFLSLGVARHRLFVFCLGVRAQSDRSGENSDLFEHHSDRCSLGRLDVARRNPNSHSSYRNRLRADRSLRRQIVQASGSRAA